MGRANIYIRKEHEERWNNLKDKSDWVNAMLGLHDDFKVPKDPPALKPRLDATKGTIPIIPQPTPVKKNFKFPPSAASGL